MASRPKSAKAAKPRGLTKSQLMSKLSELTEMSKKDVAAVFDALEVVIKAEMRANRPVTVPGLIKVSLQRKPATPARAGRNPFTGEEIIIKAKPARNVIKVRPIKALKDLA